MGAALQLLGQRFGRLTVIGKTSPGLRGNSMWECRCDCGNTKVILGVSLVREATKSCGCLSRERTSQWCREKNFKHGISHTTTFTTWNCMKQRCLNKKISPYLKYGAKGTKVCAYLAASPHNLIAVIGERPPGLTIDRKDSSGHYSCGSCCQCKENGWPMNISWATYKEQSRHLKSNRNVTINGQTQCVAAWAEISGIRETTLRYRLRVGILGEALFQPPRQGRRLHNLDLTTDLRLKDE